MRLTEHCSLLYIYISNTSGWKTLKVMNKLIFRKYICDLVFHTALTLMLAVEQVSKTLVCDPSVTQLIASEC